MKIMRKLLFVLTLLVFTVFAMAQNANITGKVTDSAGKGIAGINVIVKGTKKGTSTSQDGSFSISGPMGATLVISGIGYTAMEVVINSQSHLDIRMEYGRAQLSEVVVTALGIKREKKALTYSTQQIGGDLLRVAANSNFMDAMSGKVAGVDIETSSSGVGGSSKVILRGNKSLTGYSEPLYVIDGVPMANNKSPQPGSYGGTDGGDGLSLINPADIESISVLKGANSSILYGSQGANGVVLINIKKGKPGKVAVNFSSSTIFDQVSTLPDFQFKYGSEGGDYSWTKPGSSIPVSALINGKSPVVNIQGNNYQKNYIKDFFRIGTNFTNAVSVQGGSDKTTVYFSYANTSTNGTMPTNTYGRNQFSFNQSTKFLNDKLVLSSNVMFSSEKSNNRTGAGYYNNPLTGLYLFARDRDFNYYKQNYAIYDSARSMPKMNWYSTEEKQNNPYWEINEDPKLQTSNRVFANVKLAFEIVKHLRFETRGNIDYNDVIRDYRYAADGNSVSVSPNGRWNYTRYNDRSFYADGMFIYSNTFGDLSLNGVAGVSYQKNIYTDGMNFDNKTTSLKFPNFYSFSNMPSNVLFNQTINRSIKQGAFANLTFGYRDFLFVDLAARNDWASTLALTGNDSYLYPAVGASAIISQMVKLPEVISFFKVRASLSQTSNDVPFNVVNPMSQVAYIGTIPNTQVPFTNLKPEKIVSNEYGTEMRFFKNRIGFDFTVYGDISTNQFLTLPAPSGSRYTFYYVNAGKITNKGFEITVDAEPIRNNNFSWKTALNSSKNVNKIVELIPSNPGYIIGGQDEGFDSRIMSGGSFNDLWIYKFARNDAGQIILSANNVPTKAANETKVGSVVPDFLLGWNNSFSYKNFFASVLINGKFGGVCFSKTDAFLDSYGVSEKTAIDRDNGSIPINAISGTTAVTSIDPYTYYSAVGDRNRIMEPYVFSRTNVRLGQLVIGYNFSSKKTDPVFKNASVSLIGRNLFFFYKKAPFDPEQAMSTSNAMQSNDVFTMPATRSFGLNVKFTF